MYEKTPSIRRLRLIEQLEVRNLLATDVYLVSNSNDSGIGSLRQAILDANQSVNESMIRFNIPASDPGFIDIDSGTPGGDVAADVISIRPLSPLPSLENAIARPISMLGQSQLELTGDTNPLGPVIVLDGSGVGDGSGLLLRSNQISISNLVIHSFPSHGIDVNSGEYSSIVGCYIGIDATGKLAKPNGGSGILVNANSLTVGGPSLSLRNVISANGDHGISLSSGIQGVVIQGNYLGTDADGIADLGNQNSGIVVGPGSSNILIGGSTANHGNLSSGNGHDGIFSWDNFSVEIRLNRIGTDAAGLSAIPNDNDGIRVQEGKKVVVANNLSSANHNFGINVNESFAELQVVHRSVEGGADSYYLLGPRLSWTQSNALAAQLGGHLADIADQAENDFLRQFWIESPWIGLSDEVAEGDFRWTTGLPYLPEIFRGFNENEPNGGTSENHVQLTPSGFWNDLSGMANRPSIIEFASSPNLQMLKEALVGVQIEGNSVGLDATGAATISGQRVGIHVGSSNDIEVTNNVVAGNSEQGIKVIFSREVAVRDNRVGTSANGASGLGNHGDGIEFWYTTESQIDQNLISDNGGSGIYVSQSQVAPRLVQWSTTEGGNGHWYWLNLQNATWQHHQSLASTLGGSLVTINTADENDFLVDQINTQSSNEFFIGLNDLDFSGAYTWISGQTSSYLNWDADRPGGEPVTVLHKSTGKWQDVPRAWIFPALLEFIEKPSESAIDELLSPLTILGNRIGVAADGITPLGNDANGIRIEHSDRLEIGDGLAASANIIANNSAAGVLMLDGTQFASVRNNQIYRNGGLGIDLSGDGVTDNDLNDVDSGPNGSQNYPELSVNVDSGVVVMEGTLHSSANETFTIEVFLSDTLQPSEAEGQVLIHSTTVTTDANGRAVFIVPRQTRGTTGLVTATATNAGGETSEFSQSLPVLNHGPILSLEAEGQRLADGAVFGLGATKPGVARNRTLTVRNLGDEILVVQPVVAPNGFSILSNFTTNQVVMPEATADLVLQFDATIAGSFTGTFSIATNDVDKDLPISGAAISKLTLLKDLNPGLANSTPNSMIPFNGAVYFLADDGENGEELWKTDGTTAGTVMVKDINPGAGSSYVAGLAEVNGWLVFSAEGDETGSDMWRTDGTETGTQVIKDMGPNGYTTLLSSRPNLFESSSRDVLYFSGDDGSGAGEELWRTDGTESGTFLVKDIIPGNELSLPASFFAAGDKTYFAADTADQGRELWVTDGTANGTVQVADTWLGAGDGAGVFHIRFATINGRVMTRLNDGTTGFELWTTDGTASGTQMVGDLSPGNSSSLPEFFGRVGNKLVFFADNGTHGAELWTTDGSAAGTQFLLDINPGADSGLFSTIAQDAGNKVYFFADGGIDGRELWVTDGTIAGTHQVIDLNPGPTWSVTETRGMSRLGSKLIFGGNDGRIGEELWVLDISEPDVTKPTSKVDPLPARATSKSFTVRVTGSDGASNNSMETVSNVASYDLYVAEGTGAYVKFASVPSTNPQAAFEAKSNTTYFFRSIARDHAGNIESKAVTAEATTYVPDFDAPVTSVESVQSATPNFQISVVGVDVGGSGLSRLKVFVSVNNANASQIAEVSAGQPDGQGRYRATVNYQAIADGASYSYRFFAIGIDHAGNKEPDKATGDLVIQKSFPAASQLSATGIDIQRGQKQRSYIRYVDLQFSTSNGLDEIFDSLNDAVISNDRIQLQRFNLDGSGLGTFVPLNGLAILNDRTIELDFGVNGLGGTPGSSAGNGYYRFIIDNDGDGTRDQFFHFYRMLGETNTDRIVNTIDVRDIALAISRRHYDPNSDLNGDGVVNLQDRNLAIGQLNQTVPLNLPNDSLDKATEIVGSSYQIVSIFGANEEDWFTFVATRTGTSANLLQIGFDYGQGDFTLGLYDSLGVLLKESKTQAIFEGIALTELPIGRYYVRISKEGIVSNNAYKFSFNLPNGIDGIHTLYLNFDGAAMTRGQLDSWNRGEWVSQYTGNLYDDIDPEGDGVTVSPLFPSSSDREISIAAIIQMVQADLEPFGIQVVRHFGLAVDDVGATTVFVGDSSHDQHIASTIDEGNGNRTDIAFVDDESWDTPNEDILAMADVILHEAGHTFGLYHVVSGNAAETMGLRYNTPASTWARDTAFLDINFRRLLGHGPVGFQNSYRYMLSKFVV